MQKIIYGVTLTIILIASFSSLTIAGEKERVLKLCETHRRLANTYDCSCYADAFIEKAQTLQRKSDKTTMTSLNAQHCEKGDGYYKVYANCLNRSEDINGTIKNYCQCFYDELKKDPGGSFPDKRMEAAHRTTVTNNAVRLCADKFTNKNAPLIIGHDRIKKRLSDYAFNNVFDFDFYICADYGIAEGQSDEKTQVRKFVNSFCKDITAIRESNPQADQDDIIAKIGEIQRHLDQELPSLINTLSGDNKIYLLTCNRSNASCADTCAKHQVNVGGVCPCAIEKLSCIGNRSIDME